MSDEPLCGELLAGGGRAHLRCAAPPVAPLAASSTALASQREFSASPPTVGVASVWWSALTVGPLVVSACVFVV